MAINTTTTATSWASDTAFLRCVDCHAPLAPRGESDLLACTGCSRTFPVRNEVLVVNDVPAADNKIAADFYNGPLWPRFRFWEKFFWVCNGGERRSRDVILRHLPSTPGLRLLDVAIGDGAYTSWLPADWSIVGLDVSEGQLANCQRRNPGRDLRFILGEAEDLPFPDRQFDAVLSIGGFNHFNDPEAALREMARVARPGAPVVVSDELPDLTNRMIGHRLGWPGLDRWVVSKIMHLGDDFTDLVERHRDIDIASIGRSVLDHSRYQTIWRGGGYLMVGTSPEACRS